VGGWRGVGLTVDEELDVALGPVGDVDLLRGPDGPVRRPAGSVSAELRGAGGGVVVGHVGGGDEGVDGGGVAARVVGHEGVLEGARPGRPQVRERMMLMAQAQRGLE
jgi:hypothetical protein